jgi:hypothetical protein
MSNRLIRIYAVLLICLVPYTSYAGQDVLGIWSSYNRTKGGLGSQVVFKEDGKVVFAFGALVDFKYVIKNNKITMTGLGPDREEMQDVVENEFRIDGDTLIMSSPTSTYVESMKRVVNPKSGKHPIVGSWTYKHYTGIQAYMRFSSHGIVQLSVPFQSASGTYRIEKDGLVIDLQNKKIQYAIIRNGDMLSLTDIDNNKTDKYGLFEY